MAHDIFICHSSTDKQVAQAICAALETKNIRCWIAPRDVIPGREYGDEILNAISDSKVVVVVFSSEANISPQVRREVERAVSKAKMILPFRIDNTLPSGAMEFCLSNTHWLDAITPPIQQHISKLVDIICSTLSTQLDLNSATIKNRDIHKSIYQYDAYLWDSCQLGFYLNHICFVSHTGDTPKLTELKTSFKEHGAKLTMDDSLMNQLLIFDADNWTANWQRGIQARNVIFQTLSAKYDDVVSAAFGFGFDSLNVNILFGIFYKQPTGNPDLDNSMQISFDHLTSHLQIISNTLDDVQLFKDFISELKEIKTLFSEGKYDLAYNQISWIDENFKKELKKRLSSQPVYPCKYQYDTNLWDSYRLGFYFNQICFVSHTGDTLNLAGLIAQFKAHGSRLMMDGSSMDELLIFKADNWLANWQQGMNARNLIFNTLSTKYDDVVSSVFGFGFDAMNFSVFLNNFITGNKWALNTSSIQTILDNLISHLQTILSTLNDVQLFKNAISEVRQIKILVSDGKYDLAQNQFYKIDENIEKELKKRHSPVSP
jgi:virulence-associated protein VapD